MLTKAWRWLSERVVWIHKRLLDLFVADSCIWRTLSRDRGIGERGWRHLVSPHAVLISKDLLLVSLLHLCLLVFELEESLLDAAQFRELRLELALKLFSLALVHDGLLAEAVAL